MNRRKSNTLQVSHVAGVRVAGASRYLRSEMSERQPGGESAERTPDTVCRRAVRDGSLEANHAELFGSAAAIRSTVGYRLPTPTFAKQARHLDAYARHSVRTG